MVRAHAEDFALVSGADIKIAVGVASQGEGQSFFRAEDGLRLGRQRQIAFFAQGNSGKGSLKEFIEGADLPEGGFHAPGGQGNCQNQEAICEGICRVSFPNLSKAVVS